MITLYGMRRISWRSAAISLGILYVPGLSAKLDNTRTGTRSGLPDNRLRRQRRLLQKPDTVGRSGLQAAINTALTGPRNRDLPGAHFFFGAYRSVMVPSNISAAIISDSLNVGWGWMVRPMSSAVAPISMASPISAMRSPA